MREYDQKLLQTVYWALNAVGGLVLIVVGLGWYTNFRLYKRDVIELKREVVNAVKADMVKAAHEAARDAADKALRDIRKIQYAQLEQEAEKWEQQGVDANAILTYIRMIDIAKSWMPEFQVPEILDNILRLLKKEDAQNSVKSLVSTEVTKALSSLPAEYASDVDAINNLLRSLKVK